MCLWLPPTFVIQPPEPHLAGQGIFFFSCIATLEAFFRTVCSRWPSLPTDYLLFEVRGMSSQRVSIFVACLCDVQTNPIPICFFSTLICQGMVTIPSVHPTIVSLPYFHSTSSGFLEFPKVLRRTNFDNSQHPTVIHSQSVVPDVQRHWFGPQITLKSPVKCKDESGFSWFFFYIFLLIWSLHFIVSIPMNVVMSHNNIQHLPCCNLVSSLWLA